MDSRVLIIFVLAVLLALIITLLVLTLSKLIERRKSETYTSKIDEENLIVTRRGPSEKKLEKQRIKEEKRMEKELLREEKEKRKEEKRLEREAKLEEERLAEEARLAELEKQRIKEEKERAKEIEKAEKNKLYTYIKIKFNGSDKEFIYRVPEDVVFEEGQKLKVQIDKNTTRTAKVVKGNYTRKKYKTYEYKTLDIVK